jgi:hypothetical protein
LEVVEGMFDTGYFLVTLVAFSGDKHDVTGVG